MVAMSDNPRRPFYAEYGWVYDLIIDHPVQQECTAIVAWLVERAILPHAGPGAIRSSRLGEDMPFTVSTCRQNEGRKGVAEEKEGPGVVRRRRHPGEPGRPIFVDPLILCDPVFDPCVSFSMRVPVSASFRTGTVKRMTSSIGVIMDQGGQF